MASSGRRALLSPSRTDEPYREWEAVPAPTLMPLFGKADVDGLRGPVIEFRKDAIEASRHALRAPVDTGSARR